MASQSSQRQRRIMGGIAAACGVFILSIATGLLETDSSSVHAPMWVIGMCGLVFLFAGVALAWPENSAVAPLMGGLIALGLGSVGGWVSLFGDSDQMSTNLPFVSHETAVMIGRWVFGLGAACCVLFAMWAFKAAFRQAGMSKDE